MPFSLKTGKSLTCFEVLTGTKNRKINEGNCKELNQHGVSPPENKRDAKPYQSLKKTRLRISNLMIQIL